MSEQNVKKRILISSTDVMMIQFLLPHIEYLSENGYIADVICSYAEGYKGEGYHKLIKERLPEGSEFFSVSLERNPYSLSNISGLREIKKILARKHYDIIWTNEPVMGVMTRLAARKTRREGTKVFYLVHGYHFFKGAPKKNWIYYPIEKVMSHFCDAMGMINWEDYYFTKKHIPKTPVYHIDGIGLDTKKFDIDIDRRKKREELGFSDKEILILSVGELQTRKNHEPVLRAIAKIDNPDIRYLICGWGELREHLLAVAKELNISDRFILYGHRYDIDEILKAVDIFIHPSQREGLGIAPLEAMASGLPIITSNAQGLKDYSVSGETGFVVDPMDVEGYKKAIEYLIANPGECKKMAAHNIEAVKKYDIKNSRVQVFNILQKVSEN